MSHIELYCLVINSADSFNRDIYGRSCNSRNDCKDPLFIDWVLESIPCEGDGIGTRDFLANTVEQTGGADFSVLRCPTNNATEMS